MRAAIAAGYAKGFRTIVDANVVTAITALILFAVATAGVKGFALMLLIGTVVSLITAVAATRAMLGLLAGFKWFENPSFMGARHSQRGRFLQIDFMGKRTTLWFAISGVVILDQRRLARDPRPQPRHRLPGRRADHVQDGDADAALDACATRPRRSGTRRTPSFRAAAPRRTAVRTTRASRSA